MRPSSWLLVPLLLTSCTCRRFDQSATELDKLAQSPHLDEKTRTELTAAAVSMRSQEHALPLMLEARATFILAQALLSRAGGVEHLLSLVVGDEHAKQLALPLTWLERTRRGLAGASPASAWQKGKELLKK